MRTREEELRAHLLGLGHSTERVDAAMNILMDGGALGDPLLTPKQLATVLGVCETTVWRINPPYYRVGKRKRYRLQEVLDFMQEQQP